MKTVIALLTVLMSATLQAAPVALKFATTVNATALGGGAATPLIVTYTFDSALPNGSGEVSPGPTLGSYGPLTMQIQLGGDVVSASGGGINVFNNAGVAPFSDSYDVRPSNFSGQLFGRNLTFFRFQLVDVDSNMFSSTALPLSPGFAAAADFQQTQLNFGEGSLVIINEAAGTPPDARTPFTLTVAPEPSTIGVVALCGLAIGRRRRVG